MGPLLGALVLLGAHLWGSAVAQCLSDGALARIADVGRRGLEGQRYNVTTEGALGKFDFHFAPANYTTAGVNPSSRYLVPRLGPWRDEGDLGNSTNWRKNELTTLTSRQALVVVMCTPPPVLMWSLETAILYRMNRTASHTPGAPISNTENSATLPAAMTNAPLLVVMTADSNTERDVRSAFGAADLNMSVATIVINGTSSLLDFGTRAILDGCDLFQLCMRVHGSPAQTSTAAFKAYETRRFPILLLEPDFPATDAPLYPIADRPMRRGPTTEAGLELRRGLLSDAVEKHMKASGLELRQRVGFHPVELDKRRCLLDSKYHPYGTGNCFGTSSDGRYTLSDDYKLPANVSSLVVVVVGANHAATGNAADNQLLHRKNPVADPGDLAGSAEFYLGGAATPADGGLFAYAFAEDCATGATGSFCKAVESQTGGEAGALLRLEAYLDNESGTRPSPGLVHPVALVFTAK